jgi:hypothetical protein
LSQKAIRRWSGKRIARNIPDGILPRNNSFNGRESAPASKINAHHPLASLEIIASMSSTDISGWTQNFVWIVGDVHPIYEANHAFIAYELPLKQIFGQLLLFL